MHVRISRTRGGWATGITGRHGAGPAQGRLRHRSSRSASWSFCPTGSPSLPHFTRRNRGKTAAGSIETLRPADDAPGPCPPLPARTPRTCIVAHMRMRVVGGGRLGYSTAGLRCHRVTIRVGEGEHALAKYVVKSSRELRAQGPRPARLQSHVSLSSIVLLSIR